MEEKTRVGALFVASYNCDLAALKSSARVGLPTAEHPAHTLELQNGDGNFLCFVPTSASPEMVDIAYRLYVHGLSRGMTAGEQSAWAKLRLLIGAAADFSD